MFQLQCLCVALMFGVCTARSFSKGAFVLGTGLDPNFQENSQTGVTLKPTLNEDGEDSNQAVTYCGVHDPSPDDGNYTICPNGRCKRYAHYNIKWKSNLVKYRIGSYPWRTDMSQSDTRRIVAAAYKLWSDATPLEFKEVGINGKADTVIKFAARAHGDRMKFDGPGNELAHAYHLMGGYKDLNGDIHFDGEEYWTKYKPSGYKRNLFTVLAHEIGHTLGLSHSTNPDALMYRYYQRLQQNYKLSKDDIAGIQDLYGPNPEKKVVRVKKAFCNPGFDATLTIRGELFSFDNTHFWRVSSKGKLVSPQEGHVGSTVFRLLPQSLDAAYERPTDGKLIFFKGSHYYEYSDFYLSKWKQPIYLRYPRVPRDGIDAVMAIPKTKKTYFFKGPFVWRFDERLKRVDSGYPTTTSKLWLGAPTSVTAAFYVNHRIVLISNDAYYILKKKSGKKARIGKGKFSENVMRLKCY
ncbi:stromelysin-1-like [Anneissia japonica]|uniref:stromelysin-1-like n=1 Tax=Anneissia japonica TaxID=1529436 RepID=UPI0014256640|nr:stromelysin-1-like [Anneissia japonica]